MHSPVHLPVQVHEIDVEEGVDVEATIFRRHFYTPQKITFSKSRCWSDPCKAWIHRSADTDMDVSVDTLMSSVSSVSCDSCRVPVYCSLECKIRDSVAHQQICCGDPQDPHGTRRVCIFVVTKIRPLWDEMKQVLII